MAVAALKAEVEMMIWEEGNAVEKLVYKIFTKLHELY